METHYFLLKALCSLKPGEQNSFKKFLQSTYFRKKSTSKAAILKLYISILKNFHIIKNNSLDLDKLISDTLNKKTAKKTSEIKSELLQYFYDFIGVEGFLKKKREFKLAILEALVSRKLNNIFEHFVKVNNIDDFEPAKENEYLYYLYKRSCIFNKYMERKGKEPNFETELELLELFLKKEKKLKNYTENKKLVDFGYLTIKPNGDYSYGSFN